MKPFCARTITLRGRLSVKDEVRNVFPLFSPEGEKHWVPGWDPEFLYPAESAWQQGQIFRTQEEMGEAVWVISQLDPAQHTVEYHRIEPARYVACVQVCCRPSPDRRTEVSVSYSFVGLSEIGNRDIEAMSQKEYVAKMSRWADWIARMKEGQ